MKKRYQITGMIAAGLLALGALGAPAAYAQDPVLTPILADTAASIIVGAVKPKPKATGLAKFEGYVMHANNAQVTVRGKNNDMTIRTFSLAGNASAKMQQVIDKGGYQYGDKITVLYDPQTLHAVKFKGKPSKAL